MQKSSKLFLSLLVISGMVLNACGGADGVEEIIEDTSSETEVDLDFEMDGKSGEEDDEEEEEEVTEEVDDSQALADAIREDLAELPETTYANGTYSASGDYQSPAGPEDISVTLIIQDDVITSATVVPQSTNDTSLNFQEKFAGGVVMEVVGMDLNELDGVSAISGSSLTPKGFNSALASIKAQAS